ncbi:SDR family oxidoreductase [Rubripirellula amarantea]|uniref:General stress protein 39 n=1 Tax=Rubripirellula amarantea TaxID=2527999 RepID=A0A5C5WUA3_9BACT|nr:SDR family oxidoreductase [Rubripirellula amarantea]MDA8746319.1 SDR family oxidoreductase [Rubripirellula amarantea]TWT54120.1 General stress protein 39 [Rubripirellula amarantea]
MTTLQQNFATTHPVALVTGSGAPRVGRAIAEHLASLGCHIALHANTSVDEADEAARSIADKFEVETLVTLGSLEDTQTASRLVDETVGKFGRIDVLVNSAAIWHPTPFADIEAAEVQRYFTVNTLSSFLAARAAGVMMAKQDRGGCVVNIGDWATVRPYLDHAAYFPSKGAIEVMTRSLAVELSQLHDQIRVNCIQPGPVLLADDVGEARAKQIAASTLVNRVGTAGHIAHAVQFLCENDFINGVCLPVDGGRSIYAPDGMQVGANTG